MLHSTPTKAKYSRYIVLQFLFFSRSATRSRCKGKRIVPCYSIPHQCHPGSIEKNPRCSLSIMRNWRIDGPWPHSPQPNPPLVRSNQLPRDHLSLSLFHRHWMTLDSFPLERRTNPIQSKALPQNLFPPFRPRTWLSSKSRERKKRKREREREKKIRDKDKRREEKVRHTRKRKPSSRFDFRIDGRRNFRSIFIICPRFPPLEKIP